MESIDFQVWQIDKDEDCESAKLRLEFYETDDGGFVVEVLTDDDTGHTHTLVQRTFTRQEDAQAYFDKVECNTDAYLWLLASGEE